MKRETYQKGFTLIELLVVVAIIVILATTILVALGGARAKARNARATSELSSMRAQAELYYNEHDFTYRATADVATGCAADLIAGPIAKYSLVNLYKSLETYPGTGSIACSVVSQSWAVAILLPAGAGVYCADSNGISKRNTTATTAVGAITSDLCN